MQKQLLSSPTISHDEEDQQSDGAAEAVNEKEQDTDDGEDKEEEEANETEGGIKHAAAPPPKAEVAEVVVVKAMYGNRDVLDLFGNLMGTQHFVKFTVLPENNVNCFFQNRAQYWRLSSCALQEYSLEKCSCCDFTYPSNQQHLNPGSSAAEAANANPVTDSLMKFVMSNEPANPAPIVASKRFMNNSANSAPYGYPAMPPQPPTQPQQYQPQNSGFYNGSNNNNSFNSNYNQPMNPYMSGGAGGGYGSTVALLNMMSNSTRNVTNAFQAMSNVNNSRYYNNNNMNNGYGLYKQF